MKNKVLLPAAVCAALPLLWAIQPSGGLDPAASEAASAPARHVDPSWAAGSALALSPLAKAGAIEHRVAVGSDGAAALEELVTASIQAPIPPLLRKLPLHEAGPKLAASLNSRLALFDKPTDGMYASWYAGTSLENLARVHFDGALVTNALIALDSTHPEGRTAASAFGLGNIVDRHESFSKEVAWLETEVLRRVETSREPVTVALASATDDDLMRAYPGPADRYVLGALLRREYHSLAREAARSEFAKLRALTPEERTKSFANT